MLKQNTSINFVRCKLFREGKVRYKKQPPDKQCAYIPCEVQAVSFGSVLHEVLQYFRPATTPTTNSVSPLIYSVALEASSIKVSPADLAVRAFDRCRNNRNQQRNILLECTWSTWGQVKLPSGVYHKERC